MRRVRVTRVTNAGADAANTSIDQIKRTAGRYRYVGNNRAPILLAGATETAA